MNKLYSENNSRVLYSVRFYSVALGLQKLVRGSSINDEEHEIFSWGATFLESLYDLPVGQQNDLPQKPQRDQHLESLIRRYYGSFYEKLQEANIPLQQDYGRKAAESLRYPEHLQLNNEQLKDLQKAFAALARKMQNHEITYNHEGKHLDEDAD